MGDAPSFDEVDVVTAGTCGVMSGTAAILNFVVSPPGEFIRAREVFLNGIPAYAGPCPNEWLGSLDVILHGTTHSIDDPNYGGGFLLKELLQGNGVDVHVESVEGKTIENTITLIPVKNGYKGESITITLKKRLDGSTSKDEGESRGKGEINQLNWETRKQIDDTTFFIPKAPNTGRGSKH